MDQAKVTDESPIEGVVQLLRQVLQLYKEPGKIVPCTGANC